MASGTYKFCVGCGNSKKGFNIYQCRNCGYIGCYDSVFIFGSDGCFTSNCPKCDKNDYKHLGYIE